ncbi:MAG: TetR family transcriptional regulator [Kineosporiaceae bacterium]
MSREGTTGPDAVAAPGSRDTLDTADTLDAAEPAPRRRGRRPAGHDTRGAILAAARAEFAERGYDGATMRGIARAAGVDPRLVHHYFASREELFVEALDLPDIPARLIARVLDGPRAELGARLVRQFFGMWDHGDRRQTITGLLSVATSSGDSSAMFRQFLSEAVLRRLAAACDADDPELRATLVAAQMLGAAMLRYALLIEPIASADVEDLVALLAPTIQGYLTGEVTVAANLDPGR